MNFLTPEVNTILMFGLLLLGIFLGYQIAFLLAGIGLLFGISLFGPNFIGSFSLNFLSVMKNYILLAIPLFVLMGNVMERSGASEKLFGSIYILSGRLRGGLAVATTIIATIFAACTGVVGASVVTMGVLSLPAMLKRGYDKYLVSGVICASGCLGVLIPPSIMIVIYGPTAGIPVGKLFMAAVGPGLALSASYILYALIRCYINPKLGPPISLEELAQITGKQKVKILLNSILPPIFIILAVLGTIFFGIAAPTEAAATGAAAAGLLAVFYRKFNWKMVGEASESTLRTTSMILTMTAGAVLFVSTFMSMGGGAVVERIILSLPFGKWGILILMLFVVFILGMFLDWVPILLLVVPLYTPIAAKLGFDAIWFAIMVILNLQLSYLTPPFALATFYFRGIAPPEITMKDIYVSVIPFLVLQIIVFFLCVIYPGIILWLPSKMGTGW
jgi:tripartite ATP-independent transporter DctM subunit